MLEHRPFVLVGVVCLILFVLYKNSEPEQRPRENLVIEGIRSKIIKLNKQFKHLDIREADSSFTEDKSVIYLCLRDKDTGQPYDMNTLIYVILHELAHLLNKDNYGHTPEFYDIFNKLLCKAEKEGIYDSTKPREKWYCGVDISDIEMPTCSTIQGIDQIEKLTI